jgi:hypothetical protein
MDQLKPEKAAIVPANGVVLPSTALAFNPGETVFDALLRAAKSQKMQLEFTNVPLYHSAYIDGIANIYEFDCGPLSGWMYRVNGVFPGYGCSKYPLRQGDVVEWIYTCDQGADIGGGVSQKG